MLSPRPVAGEWASPAAKASAQAGALDINGRPLRDVTIKTMPGLNHLFQPCKTGEVTEYGSIEQTMSPEVLDLIAGWIAKRVG